jgi:DNA-binding CsgD family transcriptional regulator
VRSNISAAIGARARDYDATVLGSPDDRAVDRRLAGETLRRRDPTTIDELTPQELQIALLLAAGKTTREAAAALFLSPKTIEYHLRHVYQKLAINSREELAQALDAQTSESIVNPHAPLS